MMKICEQFAESHSITFNPTKTKLLCFNMKPESVLPPIYLNGEKVSIVEHEKHLGNYVATDIADRNMMVQKSTAYTWLDCCCSTQHKLYMYYSSCPPQWGPVSTVFWAGRPSGPAGWLALLLLKAGDVETNPGPKHTRTQVWICDVCHREITRKQTSLRCNHSEHWVHLRCAHIRVDQYTDTWICHLHRGSRLPHATYTSPHFPLASSKPLLHSPPTPPHPKHQHTSNSPTSPLK